MTGQAINIVLITFVIVLLFHVSTELIFKKKEKVQATLRSIAIAIVVAALALLFHLNLENVHKMEEIHQELAAIREINSGLALYKPYETMIKLPESNTFRKVLSREMNKVKSDIDEIGRGQIFHTADEFVSTWEVTVGRYAKTKVDVITSISIEDLKKRKLALIMTAHDSALSRGVKIRRILIYHPENQEEITKLSEIAGRMSTQQVEVRCCPFDRIDDNPSTEWMLKKLGTYDIKIIDDECLFCSIVGEKEGM